MLPGRASRVLYWQYRAYHVTFMMCGHENNVHFTYQWHFDRNQMLKFVGDGFVNTVVTDVRVITVFCRPFSFD